MISQEAKEKLDLRLVNGEITKKQYSEIMETINGSSPKEAKRPATADAIPAPDKAEKTVLKPAEAWSFPTDAREGENVQPSKQVAEQPKGKKTSSDMPRIVVSGIVAAIANRVLDLEGWSWASFAVAILCFGIVYGVWGAITKKA